MLWKVCEQVGYDACELHFKSVKDIAKYLQLKEVVESGDAGDHRSRHPQLFCPVMASRSSQTTLPFPMSLHVGEGACLHLRLPQCLIHSSYFIHICSIKKHIYLSSVVSSS